MEKLDLYIQAETKNGFKILKEFSPWHGPGIVNYEKNCVVLNQRFLMNPKNSFTEDDLIGVLYHEIGHLKYFKIHPVTKKEFNEDYKTKSEYFAFENALKELLEIAKNGDVKPLISSFIKINDRIKKIQQNDFKDENNSQSHIHALLQLTSSPIYNDCVSYLNHY